MGMSTMWSLLGGMIILLRVGPHLLSCACSSMWNCLSMARKGNSMPPFSFQIFSHFLSPLSSTILLLRNNPPRRSVCPNIVCVKLSCGELVLYSSGICSNITNYYSYFIPRPPNFNSEVTEVGIVVCNR